MPHVNMGRCHEDTFLSMTSGIIARFKRCTSDGRLRSQLLAHAQQQRAHSSGRRAFALQHGSTPVQRLQPRQRSRHPIQAAAISLRHQFLGTSCQSAHAWAANGSCHGSHILTWPLRVHNRCSYNMLTRGEEAGVHAAVYAGVQQTEPSEAVYAPAAKMGIKTTATCVRTL